jgi:hypothetical protein
VATNIAPAINVAPKATSAAIPPMSATFLIDCSDDIGDKTRL